MTHAPEGLTYWPLVAMWWGMSLLMIPTTWPWLRALARLASEPPARTGRNYFDPLAITFAAAYLLVWLVFSLCAAAVQLLISRAGGALLDGGAAAAAGLYQLTPLKRACLERCRSPFSALLSRWPLRARAAFELGLEHGVVCVGCCWTLMLVALAAGATGWLWMGALMALVALEKLTRFGPRLARWSGLALLGVALATWLRL